MLHPIILRQMRRISSKSVKRLVEGVPTHDVLVIMVDFNAKIGNLNADIERAIGKHWWGKIRVVPISINFDYRLSITDYLGFRIYQLIEIIDSSLL